ncbi:sigma-70 family RNA polymerase sigma factor [Luteimonas sp. MJ293]|uniref:RNA polymerase sigma factor n=1 Tax=Luteimonas sp. MJ146 TaxID=3129240 RepID=UPI0031B9F142
MKSPTDIDAVLRDHGAMLFRIATGYTRTSAAREDLVQDMSVALWKALPAYRGDGPLKAFVARIAQFTALDHVRRRVNRTDSASLDEHLESTAPRPEQYADGMQERDRLREAVRGLPGGQRECVLLVLEGFGHREIAEILGVAHNTVDQRLSRARQQLRGMLGGRNGK